MAPIRPFSFKLFSSLTLMKKPKILAITSELPWPLNTGGHLRTCFLLKAIAGQFDLTLVVPIGGGDEEGVQALSGFGIKVEGVEVSPRSPLGEAKRALLAAVRSEPYVMFHRHNRKEVRGRLAQLLRSEHFDAVYIDHLDPYVFRDLFPAHPIIVDVHNVYSLLAERVAREHSGPRQWYLLREARFLAGIERKIAADATALTAVSQEEQEDFSRLGNDNVHLVANGVDCSHYFTLPVGRTVQPPVLLYIGALSWQPNAQAAKFLAHHVIGKVREKYPDAVLRVVGRSPDRSVMELAQIPGVEVHADVPDIGVYLEQASLLTVALDSGGGTRLKILEAFAAGLPVVSTATGCEGIDCEHERHLLIASRDEFPAAIDRMLSAPQQAQAMAENGRRLVEQKYDWGAQGSRACKAIESVLT